MWGQVSAIQPARALPDVDGAASKRKLHFIFSFSSFRQVVNDFIIASCMMRHRRQGNTDGLADDGIFVVILRSAARGGALACIAGDFGWGSRFRR